VNFHLGDLFIAWDEAHVDLQTALTGTPDADLWVRPHPRLVSVGELGGHVAFWEVVNVFESSARPASFLNDQRFAELDPAAIAPDFDVTTEQLAAELARLHGLAVQELKRLNPTADQVVDFKPEVSWKWRVTSMVIHAAYHAGQIYSARHVLGHETPEN
jgi:hypothetical protein